MIGKKNAKITGKTIIADLIEKWPETASVLVEEYGFHCIGCGASAMETLSQGAMVHGMSKNDIKVMIENLNELIKTKKN